ncbi:UDP-Glycosyltransferase/glycogen phosphorylase [Cladorrhinum samala]|uniref:Alpha-1,3/1,6-mannosyltransferase ALG2 n=1 Tax=Cladorrhinum samala TaxID=585594 RepID=A0AAV9HJH8_9PEZI|nr:UDP-Glycosyltransferase/glycogen phosphorylase [Cladorrhinum samala]
MERYKICCVMWFGTLPYHLLTLRLKEMSSKSSPSKKKTLVFLHPDLGIGGAERLVVDAAVGLQKRGHKVIIFTSHCDPAHCFDEARDGTLDVRVRGNTLIPPSILGRFSILCAILRQLHLILQIALFTSELSSISPSAFFVDQLSAGLPLLKMLLPGTPVFFYCHFPDLLLVQNRQNPLKRLYRIPFDALEQFSMGCADAVAVNSGFTRSVVTRTWPSLAAATDLKIVYPCIDTTASASPSPSSPTLESGLPWSDILLSINRFERKKDVALAVRAFALLPPTTRRVAKLIIAGGYDPRVAENVSYHSELVELCSGLGLPSFTAKTLPTALSCPAETQVLFLLSVPNTLKEVLLRSAKLLLYTPSNEHFGIVPLEAMLRGLPVLAADSGGPTETVVEGETGWLRDPGQVDEWKAVMEGVLAGKLGGEEMGRKGKERVVSKFGADKMAERLEEIFEGMEKQKVDKGRRLRGLIFTLLGGIVAVVVAGGLSVWMAR